MIEKYILNNYNMENVVQPYVDLNFVEPPKWIVDVKFKEWRNLPQQQKNLMIKERLLNARTSEELNLVHNLIKIEHNSHHLKYKSD